MNISLRVKLHTFFHIGDEITVTVNEKIECGGKEYKIVSLPENLMEILDAGGLVKAMRKRNGLEG